MKSLIITVAGMSSRFNRDTKDNVLKCLYYEGAPARSLLSFQVHQAYGLVDEIIVVGGYKYEDLELFVRRQLKDINQKIRLVYNDHYHDYGSAYSLLKGIEAQSDKSDEVAFIEGDLFFGADCLTKIFSSKKDVISINNEPILSNKAVALYFDAYDYPHYVYDTNHSFLEINEPFTAIYNSGQMWKFMTPKRLRTICQHLTLEQKQGTNLEIIQRYFETFQFPQLDIIRIPLWYNCNTVADYREAVKSLSL